MRDVAVFMAFARWAGRACFDHLEGARACAVTSSPH
jgi:hypothetical protein